MFKKLLNLSGMAFLTAYNFTLLTLLTLFHFYTGYTAQTAFTAKTTVIFTVFYISIALWHYRYMTQSKMFTNCVTLMK